MADKKYYWLKLKRNFFDDIPIMLIEKEENSDAVLVCYLKMLFISVPSGKIYMSHSRLASRLKITEQELKGALKILQFYQLAFDEGGIIALPYVNENTVSASQEATGRDRNSADYRNWREAVFRNDNYTCQACQRRGVKLNAHHIKSWRNYPAERFNVKNGITLCEGCHKKIHRSEKQNGGKKNVRKNNN